MLFYLTAFNLAKFLYENAPDLKENEMDRQVVATMEAWKHADFLCKNYILNGLDNTLCIVRPRPQRSCGIPWTRSTRQKMPELKVHCGQIFGVQNGGFQVSD